MTILREPIFWKRERQQKPIEPPWRLTPKEQANVKAAIAALRIRHRTLAKMAQLMGMNHKTLEWNAHRRGKPTRAMAVKLAALACVSTEDVIYGRWPKPGCCPYCGR